MYSFYFNRCCCSHDIYVHKSLVNLKIDMHIWTILLFYHRSVYSVFSALFITSSKKNVKRCWISWIILTNMRRSESLSRVQAKAADEKNAQHSIFIHAMENTLPKLRFPLEQLWIQIKVLILYFLFNLKK